MPTQLNYASPGVAPGLSGVDRAFVVLVVLCYLLQAIAECIAQQTVYSVDPPLKIGRLIAHIAVSAEATLFVIGVCRTVYVGVSSMRKPVLFAWIASGFLPVANWVVATDALFLPIVHK